MAAAAVTVDCSRVGLRLVAWHPQTRDLSSAKRQGALGGLKVMRQSFTGIAIGLILGALSLTTGTMAAGTFNGTYAGMQHGNPNNSSAGGHCSNLDHPVKLVVADNVAKYAWGQETIEAPIGNDGSFSGSKPGWAGRGGSGQAFTLAGRISGGNLEADVGTTVCGAHLSLKKG